MSRSSGPSDDRFSSAQDDKSWSAVSTRLLDSNFGRMDRDDNHGRSLQENSINAAVENVGTAVDNIRLLMTNIQPRYSLTELSIRKKAAKKGMERERETERRANETVKCGTQVTRKRSEKPQINHRFKNLVRINDNRLYCDNSGSVDGASQGVSLDEKIKTLELNFKKLENDLIEAKNRLVSMEEPRLIVNDRNNFDSSDSNTIDKNSEINVAIAKKDYSNSAENLDKSTCFFDGSDFSLNKYIYDTPKIETRLTISPKNIEFKMTSNAMQRVSKQHIKVTNRSKSTIICRYSHLFDPNAVLRDDMNVIKVTLVTPCRLRPAMAVDFPVTFKTAAFPHTVRTYQSLENVQLVFECSNGRSEVKTVFHIPVNFRAAKPEPELVTQTITFPPNNDSNTNVNPKKYLILKNDGDADCVFSVLKESEYQTTRHDKEKNVFVLSGQRFGKMQSRDSLNDSSTGHSEKYDKTIFEDIVRFALRKMFTYFSWRRNTNVLLRAKGSAKVPVTFNQNFAHSSVSESFVIAFNNSEHANVILDQRVNVVGCIKERTLLVKPDVIDVGLCYLTCSEQVVSFQVQNNSRVVIPFEIRLPCKGISRHVELSHSKGYLRANSSLQVAVRLRLKYDILWSDDCAVHFNADTGFLDFPIRVYSSESKTCCEVRVLAVVTTPFGLTLTPDRLDFGTVNTTETVVRSVALANHSRTPMSYGFLDLPELISIYPSAFGIIFPGENICLHVYYSPKIPKRLPRDVYMFEVDFILTCSTITGLNADKIHFESETTEQIYEKTTTEEPSTINDSNKSITIANHTNELDHGPDKIQIQRLTNAVEINALKGNAGLKEATIKCHARIHEIPVELSVQKIIFEKTQYTSFSTFNIDLRASNLLAVTERKVKSFLDFKIRFEFVSDDPSVEFKPKNGIMQSKEVIQICVIFRPKFDQKSQDMYEKRLDFVSTNIKIDQILKDGNHCLNLVDHSGSFSHDKIKIFEANRVFYSTLTDKTKIVSVVCYVQFVNKKSIEYFGFDMGSLKLSVVCPTTKPNVILFADQIHFGECTINVRHDQWLFVRNITERPVPLKISPPSPIGPFFCSFALNGKLQSLYPGLTVPIKVSFTPEHESTVNETVEVASETTRLTVKLSGSGLGPSCDITPDDTFNIIHTTHEQSEGKFVFRVTNTSGTGVRFNVQLEWTKQRSNNAMTDDEAYEFTQGLRLKDRSTADLRFDGPDWTTGLDGTFDLGNGDRPLWFRLKPKGVRYVEVTFKPPDLRAADGQLAVPKGKSSSAAAKDLAGPHETDSGGTGGADEIFWRRVYVAKINVHVGQSVLRWFYVLGIVLMKTPAGAFQDVPVDNNTTHYLYSNTGNNA